MIPISFVLAALLGAASAQPVVPPLGGCRLEAAQEKDLAPVGDIYRFRVDSKAAYVEFHIDFRSQAWIGGINVCGQGSSSYGRDKTLFRVDRVGPYVVYSAHCGGKTAPWDAKAQVIFENGARKPSYVRTEVKVAKWSLPNGLHSGPIKQVTDNVSCASTSVDASQVAPLSRFDELASFIEPGGRQTSNLSDLFAQVRR